MDDISQYLRFAAALLFVLGLIGGAAYGVRAFGLLNSLQRRPSERRLKLGESLSLDARRRVVLVQRDDREYLILLSPQGETVLDKDIHAPAPAPAAVAAPVPFALFNAGVRL